MVFVEGVDGSGKTILCEKLNDEGFTTIRVPRNVRDARDIYNLFKSYRGDEVFIFDRSFISELVYRLHDKRPCTINMSLSDMLNVLQGSVIVHCVSDTSFADSIARGEDNITNEEEHNEIKFMYETVMDMFSGFEGVTIFEYDWKTHNYHDLIKGILQERDVYAV